MFLQLKKSLLFYSVFPILQDDVNLRFIESTCKKSRLWKPVIWNITNCPKAQICRWYHQRGKITDIIKTGCQVKIILNLIFGKLFEPTDTYFTEWIFWSRTPVSNFNLSSYKTACDINLKPVFLAKFGLWWTPAPRLH